MEPRHPQPAASAVPVLLASRRGHDQEADVHRPDRSIPAALAAPRDDAGVSGSRPGMASLLQIDFPFEGPFGAAMAAQLGELASSIAEEPGLIWKIWTENPQERTAGGIYLFGDETSARAYLDKHLERLRGFGIAEIRARVFAVNSSLTSTTHGPLQG